MGRTINGFRVGKTTPEKALERYRLVGEVTVEELIREAADHFQSKTPDAARGTYLSMATLDRAARTKVSQLAGPKRGANPERRAKPVASASGPLDPMTVPFPNGHLSRSHFFHRYRTTLRNQTADVLLRQHDVPAGLRRLLGRVQTRQTVLREGTEVRLEASPRTTCGAGQPIEGYLVGEGPYLVLERVIGSLNEAVVVATGAPHLVEATLVRQNQAVDNLVYWPQTPTDLILEHPETCSSEVLAATLKMSDAERVNARFQMSSVDCAAQLAKVFNRELCFGAGVPEINRIVAVYRQQLGQSVAEYLERMDAATILRRMVSHLKGNGGALAVGDTGTSWVLAERRSIGGVAMHFNGQRCGVPLPETAGRYLAVVENNGPLAYAVDLDALSTNVIDFWIFAGQRHTGRLAVGPNGRVIDISGDHATFNIIVQLDHARAQLFEPVARCD